MDFSDLNVNKCEKAKQLQQKWDIVIGDYYFDKSTTYGRKGGLATTGAVCVVDEKILIDVMQGDFVRSKSIWLPRQDQFQRLMNLNAPIEVINKINSFTDNNDPQGFASMEQLWLAIYMRYEFNKLWDGNFWIVG
ncbi:MAG: hypothetical protein L3V56_13590 [Candidatus Magnetoovum sp. WYHC-5]|nr:hypothetical protein [Candidatus Magnetoovum sp. WYHC-5]